MFASGFRRFWRRTRAQRGRAACRLRQAGATCIDDRVDLRSRDRRVGARRFGSRLAGARARFRREPSDRRRSVAGITAAVNGGRRRWMCTGSDTYTRLLVSALAPTTTTRCRSRRRARSRTSWCRSLPTSTAASCAFAMRSRAPMASGPISSRRCAIVRAGSGDFQASVAWTGASDVDLHVFDPTGEEVFYGNRDAASGGTARYRFECGM